jgi:di/tricarboxylate transporter
MNDINRKLPLKNIIMAVIFLVMGLFLSTVTPNIQVSWTVGFLLLTIYLFVSEIVEVDIAAITIMVLLGLTSLPFVSEIMGISGALVDSKQLFNGFASNAVMSIIAVMIIGAGLDKTGMMSKVASFILQVGGKTETRIIPIISSTVAVISSFMQNVGAAALFLPVVSRISSRSGLPMSRLLMPMGFCAILGGTVTMVGSSPLILLNDLIDTSNKTLDASQQMDTWGLFSVTPIGLVLVTVGILYFVIAGRFVLPTSKEEKNTKNRNVMQDVYGVHYELHEMTVPNNSSLVGKHFDDVETTYKIRIISTQLGKFKADSLNRDSEIQAGHVLAVLANPDDIKNFSTKYDLKISQNLKIFSETLGSGKAGIAEIVIPPSSGLIGQSARDIWLRQTTGLAMVGLHRDGNTMHEGDDIRSLPFKAGDTLIVHTTWEVLAHTEKNKDFLVVTSDYPKEESRPNKLTPALIFFGIALFLVLFTEIRLSIALLTGALGMIISGVLKIEEAYTAVSWKTVFLLASLIPLGMTVEETGTAKWIAEQVLSLFSSDTPVWVIQTAIAILATFFTLVMSNVGATVLLVPLAVNIALGVPGADPAIFALTVAIATSNSFLIPTHQVNALIMGPGGYRVPDYVKAGGIMTVLFLVVMISMMNLVL